VKVIVCGSRYWNNVELVINRLKDLPEGSHIIHGDCKGADRIAGTVGKSLGFKVTAVPAEWNRFGDNAGPLRNTDMLNMNPHLVIAFHNNLLQSRGTKDMVLKTVNENIPVEVVRERRG